MNRQLLHRQLHPTTPTVTSGSPRHGAKGQKTFIAQVWYNKKGIFLMLFAGFLYLTLYSAGVNGPWRLFEQTNQYKTTNKKHKQTKPATSCENVGVKNDGSYAPILDDDSNDYWPMIPDEHWNCMTRVFETWNSTHAEEEQHSWCNRPNSGTRRTPARKAGLILVKVHKAASSTLAGVNMRIAHRYGNCASLQHHEDSRVYHNSTAAKSFMYTSIRHPVHRAISWIFYTSSNDLITNMTDELVLERLRTRTYYPSGTGAPSARNLNEAGAQVGYMHTGQHSPLPLWEAKQPQVVQNFTLASTRVQQVMNQYDFIVIVERLSESLVVLQLLLHLKPTDILYLSAKKSGGYSYNAKPNPGCHKLHKNHISPAVKAYLSSPQWLAQNYQDYLLYKAANASLDRTIEALGRQRFDQALAEYQALMIRAKKCEDSAIFPCSDNGTVNQITNCYASDWGCGYPCLDQLD